MQLEEEDKKKEVKPHWKAGAIVLVLVLLIAGTMLFRGRGGAGTTQEGLADPSVFGESTEASAAGKVAPPDLTANNCEDPVTKCANNCHVSAAEVGACDWQGVGGSTATPREAVSTFASALQKIQAQAESVGDDVEVDRAYLFEQFIQFYKKSMAATEREALQNIRATSQDLHQQKAVDILLKND